ncbi:MAG: sugar transferase [Bacteroidota bacterium]
MSTPTTKTLSAASPAPVPPLPSVLPRRPGQLAGQLRAPVLGGEAAGEIRSAAFREALPEATTSLASWLRRKVKRALDIVLAGGALLVLSPILLLVAAAIRIESPGPVLYASKRVGNRYRVFQVYKFRSMYQDADQRLKDLLHLNQYTAEDGEGHTPVSLDTCAACEQGGQPCSPQMIDKDGTPICERLLLARKKQQASNVFVKLQNDPRVTRVGRFIRNTSLDELPQLLNVVRGDMSLVGNRPLPLYEAEQLTADPSVLRFDAPAGLTGLWQVSKRGKADMSPEERIELDNSYAQEHTLGGDLKIMFRTIPAMLQKEDV